MFSIYWVPTCGNVLGPSGTWKIERRNYVSFAGAPIHSYSTVFPLKQTWHFPWPGWRDAYLVGHLNSVFNTVDRGLGPNDGPDVRGYSVSLRNTPRRFDLETAQTETSLNFGPASLSKIDTCRLAWDLPTPSKRVFVILRIR